MQLRGLWIQRMLQIWDWAPEGIKMKTFNPKFALPKLDSYSVAPPEWFWQLYPKNYVCPATSMIDADKLEDMALSCGYKELDRLARVLERIREGASIGCEGKWLKCRFTASAACS